MAAVFVFCGAFYFAAFQMFKFQILNTNQCLKKY